VAPSTAIGEASHADFGITGAKNEGLIFAHGKPLRKVPQERLVDELFAEIDKSLKIGARRGRRVQGRRGRAVAGEDRGTKMRRSDTRAPGGDGGRGSTRRGRERHAHRAGRGCLAYGGAPLHARIVLPFPAFTQRMWGA